MNRTIIVTLAFTLAACATETDTTVTEFEAARMITRAACERMLECKEMDASLRDDCVELLLDGMEPAPSTTKVFGCSREQTDACAKAIHAMDCDDLANGRTSGENFDACRGCE